MSKLRFRISISLDGFVAGPNQSVNDPLGVGGERLHDWVVPLKSWRAAHGKEGGDVNESSRVVDESLVNIGATVMGRNMFGGHPRSLGLQDAVEWLVGKEPAVPSPGLRADTSPT